MFQDLDDLIQGMKKVILKGGLMLASQFDCIPGERSYHILILFLWSHIFPHHFFAIILVDSSSFSQCGEFYSIESMQYTYICIYVYVYMYSRMCIHIYNRRVHTYIYMYIRVYIYIYILFISFPCIYVHICIFHTSHHSLLTTHPTLFYWNRIGNWMAILEDYVEWWSFVYNHMQHSDLILI